MSDAVFNMRILSINDEADNLFLIRQTLRKVDYPGVETDFDSVRTKERFRTDASDLLLLDDNMPDKIGFEGLCETNQIADLNVADVFDALTMVLPIKTAWTTEAANDEIVSMSGEYFDHPEIKAFEAGFGEILPLQAAFSK